MSSSKTPRTQTIVHLGRHGDGVYESPEGPVYVRGALPGERVLVGPPAKDRKILRSTLSAVEEAAPTRRTDACLHLARCGGCPFGHMTRIAQSEVKKAWLLDALRTQKVTACDIESVLPEPGDAYRTRARLLWRRGGLGYREPEGFEVVVPEHCGVLDARIEEARLALASMRRDLKGEGEVRLSLTRLEGGEGVVAAFESREAQGEAFYKSIATLIERGVLRGATAQVGGSRVAAPYGDACERSLDFDGRALEAPVGSFRQAHRAATQELTSRVLSYGEIDGKKVLELFAGHGHFTVPMAARAASLRAVELDAPAAKSLTQNLARHQLKADVVSSDVVPALDALAKKKTHFDVVVLDPPRSGALAAVDGIALTRAARLVYVSCDAATFARDAARLQAKGYALTRLAQVDLFPDTLHAETVARFDKR